MKPHIKEPCYILIGCFCFFTSLSFFSSTNENLKQYDFLSDIKLFDSTIISIDEPKLKLVSEKKEQNKHSAKKKVSSSGICNLEHFYTCLDSIKKTQKKIRIAHFGDSMIEGDLITSTLREEFQKEFGGSGVGFIIPAPLNASFRQSISQDYSKNWETVNIKDHQKNYDIGIAGYTSVAQNTSWIKLKTKTDNEILNIYYGKSNTELVCSMEVNSFKTIVTAEKDLNKYSQIINTKDVLINFSSQSALPIYGLSLESDSGIIIDNFSFRGSSGTLFKEYNKTLLSQFQEYLNYDLIILQYGINVANNKTIDYVWYERNMLSNINFIKTAFPNTSILIIGCSDRAVKTNGAYATSKGIEPLIETQKNLAQQTQSGFLNLYEAMGGNGSMIKWVNGDTCFANKDYTHFNHNGAVKAGNIIYNSIIKDYNIWKKQYETIY